MQPASITSYFKDSDTLECVIDHTGTRIWNCWNSSKSQNSFYKLPISNSEKLVFKTPKPLRVDLHFLCKSLDGFRTKKLPAYYQACFQGTTLQSMMNDKLSPHRFWPLRDNRLKTVQMIPKKSVWEFQVHFPLLWIKDYPGLSTVKGSRLVKVECGVVGYRLNRLYEPIFIAEPKPMRTKFGIHQRLESCIELTQL